MRLARCPLVLFALATLASAAACAQSRAQSEQRPRLPKDPAQLMRIAAQQNGLEGRGIRPWYIHATWRIAPWKNQPGIQGKFEEWWSGPENYKAVYSAPNFRETYVVTPGGASTSGDAQFPDPVLRLIDPLLRSPLPPASQVGSMHFRNVNGKDKKLRLRCAGVVSAAGRRPSLAEVDLWFVSDYCFVGDIPAIRMEAAPNFKAVFNSVVQFQGRFVAESIQVARAGLPQLEIQVDDVRTTEASSSAAARENPLESQPTGR